MPRALDVTASTSTFQRSPGREGKVVFTVAAAAPAPERKTFPWWLVGLSAGVLLIMGNLVTILFSQVNGEGTGGSGELPGLSRPCGEVEPRCAEGLVCAGEELCLGDTGSSCANSGQCLSGRCERSRCR